MAHAPLCLTWGPAWPGQQTGVSWDWFYTRREVSRSSLCRPPPPPASDCPRSWRGRRTGEGRSGVRRGPDTRPGISCQTTTSSNYREELTVSSVKSVKCTLFAKHHNDWPQSLHTMLGVYLSQGWHHSQLLNQPRKLTWSGDSQERPPLGGEEAWWWRDVVSCCGDSRWQFVLFMFCNGLIDPITVC